MVSIVWTISSVFWGECGESLLWGCGDFLQVSRCRYMDELIVRRSKRPAPEVRLRFRPMLRTQNPQHGDFITGLELGAAHAVLPRLQRQDPALHHQKPHLLEEFHNVGKSKRSIQFVVLRLLYQGLDQRAANPVGLGMLVHRER